MARHSQTFLEINGEVKSIQEWAHLYGIGTATVRTRINSGMKPIEALTAPISKKKSHPKPPDPNEECMTCTYRNFTSRSHIIGAVYCEYMFWEKHRRPCPPPPNCEARIEGPFRPLPMLKVHEIGWVKS